MFFKKKEQSRGYSDQKIGIVGAGSSGIADAWFLMMKKKAHTNNTTILETEQEKNVVGGKCRTVTYTDSKAGVTSNNYQLGGAECIRVIRAQLASKESTAVGELTDLFAYLLTSLTLLSSFLCTSTHKLKFC